MKRVLAVILSVVLLLTSVYTGNFTNVYAAETQTETESETQKTVEKTDVEIAKDQKVTLKHGTLSKKLNESEGEKDQIITDTNVPYEEVEYTTRNASGQGQVSRFKSSSQSVGTEALLLLDNSGSMTEVAMKELKKACQSFASDLLTVDPTARIGIVIYESDVTAVTFDGEYFTNDLIKLYDVIDSLSSGGNTAMNAGLLKADEIFSLYGNATNKYIIHMADGVANSGTSYSGSDGKYAGTNYVDVDGNAFSYSDSYRSYASAAYNTFSAIKNGYYIYSLGFFHSLKGTQKQFCGRFLSDIQNVGYQEVTNAENLIFSFENITEDIKKTHTVSFQNNGHGGTVESQTVQPNCTVVEPTPLSESGYIFCGWYTDAGCNNPYDFSAIVNKDLTLYAKWAEDLTDVSYVVNFDLNGHGDAIDAQTIKNGELAQKPENPSASGYIFQGWYLEKSCKTKFYFSQKITRKLTLYAKWKDAFNFSLGNEFNLTIPKDVPVIGGGKLALDMSVIPVSFQAEDGTYKIAINMAEYEKTLGKAGETKTIWDTDAWNGFKDIVDTQKSNIKKGTNMYNSTVFGVVSTGMGVDFDINCVGYAEGKIEDEALKSIDGKIAISFEGKVHNDWQTVIVVVPVVIGLEGEASLNITGKVGYDFEDAKIFYDGELELTIPAIKLSGGVGVNYIADISVYGKAENKVKLGTSGGLQASLGGELGASAKLLVFSYTQPFLSNLDDPWVYYNSNKKSTYSTGKVALSLQEFSENALEEKNYEVALDGVAQTGKWKDAQILADGSENVLQNDIYSESNPQIAVTENGKKYLFFIGTDQTRTNLNKTTLMYSIYDDTTNTWGTPATVEDDKTADFQPSVAVDGNTVYVSWMDMKKEFTQSEESIEIKDFAAAAEVKIASFNGTDFNVKELTDNETADINPKTTVVNHTPYVTWVNNAANDMLTFTGTNSIQYSSYQENAWAAAKEYYTSSLPIVDLTIGNLSDQCEIAFTEDADGNLEASDDVKLYAGSLTETPTVFENNYVCEHNPQFVKLGNQLVLLWSQIDNGNINIRYTPDLQSVSSIANTENVNGATDYEIVQNGSDTWFLFTCASENNSDVYASRYTMDGLGKAVPVTSTEGNIGSVTAVYEDGIEVAYTNQKFTSEKVGEEIQVSSSTDLEYKKIAFNPDLILNSINVEQSDVVPGKNVEVLMNVENQGLKDMTDIQAVIKAGDSQVYKGKVDGTVKIGESKVLSVSVPLPAQMKAKTNLSVEVTSEVETDANEADNIQSMEIGYVDLAVTAQALFDEKNHTKAVIDIENQSGFDGTGKLVIRKEEASGDILKEVSVDLKAGEKKEIVLQVEELRQMVQSGDLLYIEALSDTEEVFTSNNVTLLTIEDVLEDEQEKP
ncbi:MAG: InlB B-repeat-containing protein, partial [Lachnospiraceae bacterium]|nr:InlB B-repeat-containing protein [Lachnospiraceae bacterium]